MATCCRNLAFRSAQVYMERANCGIRRLKSPVGLRTSAPHFHWSEMHRAMSGCFKSSWMIALVKMDALASSSGGAGCSLKNTPPYSKCQIHTITACSMKALPCLHWLSSRGRSPSSPNKRAKECNGLGHLFFSLSGNSSGGGTWRASENVSQGAPQILAATRPCS